MLSARLYLKQANRDAQSQLERYAEPLQALDWMLGGPYEAEYLWTAWKRLLPNHAHDSICGCSIDQVHREMLPRFAEAQQVGELLAATALERLAARIGGEEALGTEPIVVFNPLNWPRTEAVSVLSFRSECRTAAPRIAFDCFDRRRDLAHRIVSAC